MHRMMGGVAAGGREVDTSANRDGAGTRCMGRRSKSQMQLQGQWRSQKVKGRWQQDGRMWTMRPGRGLRGTTRVADISQQWVVVQQEAKMDSKQSNGELG